MRSKILKYLDTARNFILLEFTVKYAWFKWTLPFKIVEVLMGILVWIFFLKLRIALSLRNIVEV